MAGRTPFWKPEFHAERRPFLLQRGEIIKALRERFADWRSHFSMGSISTRSALSSLLNC